MVISHVAVPVAEQFLETFRQKEDSCAAGQILYMDIG